SDVHYDCREKCGRASTSRDENSTDIRPDHTSVLAQKAFLDSVISSLPFGGFCYPRFGNGTVFLKGKLQRGEPLKFLLRVAEYFLKSQVCRDEAAVWSAQCNAGR